MGVVGSTTATPGAIRPGSKFSGVSLFCSCIVLSVALIGSNLGVFLAFSALLVEAVPAADAHAARVEAWRDRRSEMVVVDARGSRAWLWTPHPRLPTTMNLTIPRHSMYAIYAYIVVVSGVNVGKYAIQYGVFGI